MSRRTFLWTWGLAAGVMLATGGAAVAEEGAAEASASRAELPYWPVGFKLPTEITQGWKNAEKIAKQPKADILVWTPPKAERLRAVFLIPANTDSKHVGEHDAVRRVAAKHEMGIVYLRFFGGQVIERSDPPKDADRLFKAVLDLVAKKTGVAEYRWAPWITFGKSSRGRFPFRTTWWFPKRVIASISYHGETPTWPMESWSKVGDESTMHLAINGQEEWSGTWYRHVRPCMLNYHLNTNWLTHQVVLPGVGHGNYADAHGSPGWGKPVPEGTASCLEVWDYIALYLDRALTLRVPAGAYPDAHEPIALKQVDRTSGYLVHPRAPETLLGIKWMAFRFKDGAYQTIPWPDEKHPVLDSEQGTIKPELLVRRAADVPDGERRTYFWVPDKEMVAAWLKLHKVKPAAVPVP